MILRVLGQLHDPAAGRRQRTLDVVWTALPLLAMVLLLVLAGLA